MERTAENILNETPQFESQYAINVWVENLTVPDLINQLSKYSLSIEGKIEELTDRLARFITIKRDMMKSRGILPIKILILHASFRKDYKR